MRARQAGQLAREGRAPRLSLNVPVTGTRVDAGSGVMSHQRMVNLLGSNLHGPSAPLRLGGARVLEIFQIGAVQGNLTVSVGVISYAGQLNLDIVSDEAAVPDVELFAAGMTATLGQLGVLLTEIPAGPGSG